MDEQDYSMADRVAADIHNAVDAMIGASEITRVRSAMKREDRREFLMQEAKLEASLLEHEGHRELAAQLRNVVEKLRTLQPEVVAKGQGLPPK